MCYVMPENENEQNRVDGPARGSIILLPLAEYTHIIVGRRHLCRSATQMTLIDRSIVRREVLPKHSQLEEPTCASITRRWHDSIGSGRSAHTRTVQPYSPGGANVHPI